MILALDISMRCSGIVLLTLNGKLKDFCIVSNEEILDEKLLDKNFNDLWKFVKKYKNEISNIIIERLSFGSLSSSRDLIDGNYWFIRYSLWKKLNIEPEIVSVLAWRKSVISTERQREILKLIEEKKEKKTEWQKRECVKKLPSEIKERFDEYLQKSKLNKGLFDLTDAYWLGQYVLMKNKT